MMKFIFCVVLFFSFQLLAKNNPTEFVLLKVRPGYEASPRQNKEVLDNLNNASQQISHGDVELPKTLFVSIIKLGQDAHYEPPNSTIVTPYQYSVKANNRDKEYTKHPKFSRAIDLHEFGHAVFYQNLPSLLEHRKQDYDFAKEYLLNKSKCDKDRVEFVKLGEMKQFRCRHDVWQPLRRLGYNNVLKMMLPYNEFFADVLTVTITRDPESIKNSLYFLPEVNSSNNNLSDRSFSLRPSKRMLHAEAHNLYSLSRLHIYKYYLSNKEVQNKGGSWILRKTLDSIKCAFASEDKIYQDFPRDKDVPLDTRKRLNENLNSCIDKEFAR